ncbi:dipeptide ABC transporter ATP-binding protein [Halobium palmae]|uniref:Dipeptide ABC transporter ATP-binding protein n=1 Tax=Halobium palmae TaxID=1776492 RepID=A0ABD5RWW4_9EURY
MTDELLEVEDVDITYRTQGGNLKAVSDASFSIGPNEYFGLVGESGCGKSTLADSVIRTLDENGRIDEGAIRYKGEEIQDLSEKAFTEKVRWKEISLIPQSAMNSLDPLKRVSEQAVKVAQAHTDWSREEAVEKLKELFDVVGLPESRVDDYPHQFSGGMKQRAIIAFSLLLDPSLVIADEPTTALDVIMQDQFLKYLDDLREIRDFSLLFITHDIAVVFEMCDSLAVMHGGQIAEQGDASTLFDRPRHPYTIMLQRAFPDIRDPKRDLVSIEGTPPMPGEEIDYCTFADRCPWAEPECTAGEPPTEPVQGDETHEVACVRSHEMESLAAEYLDAASTATETGATQDRAGDRRSNASLDRSAGEGSSEQPILRLDGLDKHFSPSTNILETARQKLLGGEERSAVRAVDGVDLNLARNQIQGIIGESGCGKSTLLETIIGLYDPSDGEIVFEGDPVSEFTKAERKRFRRQVQIVFQDPFNTLNPNYSVRETLAEPLKVHDVDYDEETLLEMLEEVELTPAEEYIDRGESQLSGGEKQRVSIARALIMDPDVILADEPVSMLDVSTQAAILDMLNELTEEYGVSMLYISHDLSTVSYICDRVNVMYLGRIVESAPTMELLEDAKHPYTRALLRAIPVPDPHHGRDWAELQGTPGDATDLPTGCRFKDRCPDRMEICDRRPAFEDVEGTDHQAACHLHTGPEAGEGERGEPVSSAASDGGEPR